MAFSCSSSSSIITHQTTSTTSSSAKSLPRGAPSSFRRLSLSFPFQFRRSRFPRCLAASPGPPSPSQPDPEEPPQFSNDPVSLSGVQAKFTRAWDTMQIFLAVLFWMSLFFWASVWDNKDNIRPNKGSRFKK